MYFDLIKKLIWLAFHIPCIFHAVTGLYCPGCGGTRAVKYLLQGEILMSIQYHPLVFYAAAVAAVEFVTWTAAKLSGKPGIYPGHGKFFIWLGVALTVVNFVVKNVLLVGFGVDLLSGSLF